ncbi:hypothetical protein I6F11_29470 [Ensifer sp. NBAIM29]|nr:hypothetical protein [Ensifer sp. NBAIM29]
MVVTWVITCLLGTPAAAGQPGEPVNKDQSATTETSQSAGTRGFIFQELDNGCFIIEKKPDGTGFSIPRGIVCPIVRPPDASSGNGRLGNERQGE